MSKKPKLNLGTIWDYNYTTIGSYSDRDIRAEYSRLRSIANKRIQRMSKSDWTWTQSYQKHKSGYEKLSAFDNRSDLIKELSELAHYVYGDESSISGLEKAQKKSLETLHEHGYDFVTEENWREWVDFISTYRKMFSGHSPTPEDLASISWDEDISVDPEMAKLRFNTFLEEKSQELRTKKKTGRGKRIKKIQI